MQQDHQRREQPRHQADETVVMGKLTKAGAMLLADPIMVEHLGMLERREAKQHHDEQHLRAILLHGSGRLASGAGRGRKASPSLTLGPLPCRSKLKRLVAATSPSSS